MGNNMTLAQQAMIMNDMNSIHRDLSNIVYDKYCSSCRCSFKSYHGEEICPECSFPCPRCGHKKSLSREYCSDCEEYSRNCVNCGKIFFQDEIYCPDCLYRIHRGM